MTHSPFGNPHIFSYSGLNLNKTSLGFVVDAAKVPHLADDTPMEPHLADGASMEPETDTHADVVASSGEDLKTLMNALGVRRAFATHNFKHTTSKTTDNDGKVKLIYRACEDVMERISLTARVGKKIPNKWMRTMNKSGSKSMRVTKEKNVIACGRAYMITHAFCTQFAAGRFNMGRGNAQIDVWKNMSKSDFQNVEYAKETLTSDEEMKLREQFDTFAEAIMAQLEPTNTESGSRFFKMGEAAVEGLQEVLEWLRPLEEDDAAEELELIETAPWGEDEGESGDESDDPMDVD